MCAVSRRLENASSGEAAAIQTERGRRGTPRASRPGSGERAAARASPASQVHEPVARRAPSETEAPARRRETPRPHSTYSHPYRPPADVARAPRRRARAAPWRTQRFEEGDERRHFRGREVLAVGRHVAAALEDLADELVAREPRGDVVERRPALPPCVAERVAVAALLDLEHERALPLERRAALDESSRARASPLQASMTGDQGAYAELRELPRVTATSITVSTATGRRRQLFSPSPERSGSASSARIPTTGPTSRTAVSIRAAAAPKTEKIQRKK